MTGSVLTARRAAPLAQAATGAVLVARPDALVALVVGDGAHPATWIVRFLGARMVVQGCVVGARPTRALLVGGAAVDALHAASMVLVARGEPRYRRSALASALTATMFAAASAASAASAVAAARDQR
jgi:hypothetical protein